MNDTDFLENLRSIVQAIVRRIDTQDEMIKALTKAYEDINHVIYDQFINPATEAYNKDLFDGFVERNGDKLSKYGDQLKSIEGPDFDIMQQAYEGSKSLPEGVEEGTYVDALVKQIDEQLTAIRSALGVPEDADVSVESKGAGEAEIKVEGEPAVEKEEKKEEKVEEPKKEPSHEDELKAFENELKAYAKR